MNCGARQSFWTSSFNPIWPYLDFNVNGASHKSRYFNTNVLPTATMGIEYMLGAVSNPASNTGFQNGARTGWITKASFMLNTSPQLNGQQIWMFWNSSDQTFFDYDTTIPYTKCSYQPNGKAYINDILVKDFNASLQPAGYPLFIGDINENGTPKGRTDGQGSGRLFWVKIYENNSLIHHYVPEIYNSQAGLYDKVADEHLQSTTSTSLDASSIQYGELDIRE